MFRRLSAPISVQWELTPACNLNCIHCYNYWRKPPTDDQRPKASCSGPPPDVVADEIIKNGVFQVTLTGGEPLTALKRNMAALSRLRHAGVDFNLNSNLALLDDSRISLLKEIGVKSALTSLMSFDESTHDFLSDTRGSFQATCGGIRYPACVFPDSATRNGKSQSSSVKTTRTVRAVSTKPVLDRNISILCYQ